MRGDRYRIFYFFFRRSRISVRSSTSVGPAAAAGAGFFILLSGFTTKKNIANATMRKFTSTVRNDPYFKVTGSHIIAGSESVSVEKSIFPNTQPIAGIIKSSTREVTILPNAAPITTQTARSTTLPFIANSLNSLTILIRKKIKNKSQICIKDILHFVLSYCIEIL